MRKNVEEVMNTTIQSNGGGQISDSDDDNWSSSKG